MYHISEIRGSKKESNHVCLITVLSSHRLKIVSLSLLPETDDETKGIQLSHPCTDTDPGEENLSYLSAREKTTSKLRGKQHNH